MADENDAMRLLMHIGYAKTGTTFLQRHVFPHLPDTTFHGRTYDSDGKLAEDLLDIVLPVAFAETFDAAATRAHLQRRLKPRANVISHENILRPYHLERTAQRLATLVEPFDTKILLTIRRQEDLIWSRYVHDFNASKSLFPPYTLAQAVTPQAECAWPYCRRGDIAPCLCEARGAKAIPLDYYDYLRIYDMYAALFGAANVFVLPLERLAEEGLLFELLERLLGISIGEDTKRRIMAAPAANKGATPPELAAVKDAALAEQKLMDRYGAANRALDQRLGLQLGRFGYY